MLFDQIRQKPFFILGPCVMESQELLYQVAEQVAEAGQKFNVPVVVVLHPRLPDHAVLKHILTVY